MTNTITTTSPQTQHASQHTAGPWKIEIDHALNNTRFRIHTGEEGVLAGSYPTGSPRHEANARLIAAAPMLLAALQQVVAWAEPESGNFTREELDWLDEAKAAVAEAKGM